MVRAKAKVSVPVNAAATALVMETAMKAARAKVGVVETVKAVEKLAERRLGDDGHGAASSTGRSRNTATAQAASPPMGAGALV